MNRLRLSYSLLSTWERGEIERAVQMYFHMDTPSSPQMDDGKRIHDLIEKHILKHKKLPDWLPDIKLKDPKPEEVMVVEYNDLFDLKVRLDCLDGDTILEYKTGVSSSMDYANTGQIPFYFLVSELNKVPVNQAYIIHHNQYSKTNDFTKIYNSRRIVERAKNLVDSLGPEIYEHFNREGLI